VSQSAKNQVKQEKPKKRTQTKLLPSRDLDELEVHLEYGDDRLVLLPLDDKSIYAYWEVTDARKGLISNHFSCTWEVLPKVLRVYDVTDLLFDGSNAHWQKDISLTPFAINWFLRDLWPNRNYCVDFGTYDIHGKFFSILRSDVVHTPPGTPHPWKEHKRWKRKEEANTETWTEYFTGYSIQD
jgi:uncharacterized protein